MTYLGWKQRPRRISSQKQRPTKNFWIENRDSQRTFGLEIETHKNFWTRNSDLHRDLKQNPQTADLKTEYKIGQTFRNI